MDSRNLRKERQGIVVSNKMDKTIVVAVHWKEKHPIYGKKDLAPNFTQKQEAGRGDRRRDDRRGGFRRNKKQ